MSDTQPLVEIEIETPDPRLKEDLLGAAQSPGGKDDLDADTTIAYRGSKIKRSFLESKEVIELTVSFAVGVGSGVVSNWLYAKLRGRPARLVIERREVQVDQGAIKRVLEERMTTE